MDCAFDDVAFDAVAFDVCSSVPQSGGQRVPVFIEPVFRPDIDDEIIAIAMMLFYGDE